MNFNLFWHTVKGPVIVHVKKPGMPFLEVLLYLPQVLQIQSASAAWLYRSWRMSVNSIYSDKQEAVSKHLQHN